MGFDECKDDKGMLRRLWDWLAEMLRRIAGNGGTPIKPA
jgi:hypothetical protein